MQLVDVGQVAGFIPPPHHRGISGPGRGRPVGRSGRFVFAYSGTGAGRRTPGMRLLRRPDALGHQLGNQFLLLARSLHRITRPAQ